MIINGKLDPPDQYSQYSGYAHLGAGLTVGMSGPAACWIASMACCIAANFRGLVLGCIDTKFCKLILI